MKVQFRKAGGWYNEQGEWLNGTIVNESRKCYFIKDALGNVNEYWKHRIEIREVVSVFMEYGMETMPPVAMNELPEEATYDGTYGEYSVYTVHNEAGIEDFAVKA